jgi:hypothetical protein
MPAAACAVNSENIFIMLRGTRRYEECFSFNLFATFSSVPLKGPGVSIFIETSAAANFRDSATP